MRRSHTFTNGTSSAFDFKEDPPESPSGRSMSMTHVDSLTLCATPVELIRLADIVCCEPLKQGSTTFVLQVVQRENFHFFGSLTRIEFDAKTCEMQERWVQAIGEAVNSSRMNRMMRCSQATRRHSMLLSTAGSAFLEQDGSRSLPRAWLGEWILWTTFPVRFMLRVTIPDVNQMRWRAWYPLSFLMSMVWLAIFSFCIVEVCDILHEEFHLSVAVLGFTVAAVGTSFPNVISCVVVSRQGKTSMAIANALGANIMNVFLALALPWFVQALVWGSFHTTAENIVTAVITMAVTLAMMVGIILAARCMVPKRAGVVFLIVYAIYLVITIGQEAVCSTWPLCHL